MRNETFYVPKKAIREFAGLLDELDIENNIKGVDEDGDIIVYVSFGTDEQENIEQLHQLIDPYHEENEDQERED